jgi:hypothetical protein
MYHYSHLKIFRKFAEIFAAQGAPPVSLTPVANEKNLPPVSLIPVATLPPVSLTPGANLPNLPPVSLIPVVQLDLRISPEIF